MRARLLSLLCVFVLLPTGGGTVQAMRSGADADPPSSVAETATFSRELRLRIDPADGRAVDGSLDRGRPGRGRTTIVSVRRIPHPSRRQRDPEISPGDLVVIALDASGAELGRSIISDPRLLRAETTEPDGALRAGHLYRRSVEFTVSLPDDDSIRRIEIFEPRWEETGPVLDRIGEAVIPNRPGRR